MFTRLYTTNERALTLGQKLQYAHTHTNTHQQINWSFKSKTLHPQEFLVANRITIFGFRTWQISTMFRIHNWTVNIFDKIYEEVMWVDFSQMLSWNVMWFYSRTHTVSIDWKLCVKDEVKVWQFEWFIIELSFVYTVYASWVYIVLQNFFEISQKTENIQYWTTSKD